MAYTTIDNPELYFQVTTFVGNEVDDRAITLPGSEDMAPDMVWAAEYAGDYDGGKIWDTVRGATKHLFPGRTNTEATNANGLKSFTSDGFTVGTDAATNDDGVSNVAWCWKGGTTAVPSGGSITPSAVSFSATSGFGVYKWTGTGANGNIAHGLGVAPKLLLIKNTEITSGWQVGSTTIGFTKVMYLNSTAVPDTSATVWNDTAPSATLFTVGSNNGSNKGSDVMICYAFADAQGFSQVGSYVGNGSADGTFVYTGFRPRWVMLKNVGATEPWLLLDTIRDSNGNPTNAQLEANDSGAQSDANAARSTDFLSNGFKLRYNNDALNGSGATYTYVTVAEAPFVNSNGVPCTAR